MKFKNMAPYLWLICGSILFSEAKASELDQSFINPPDGAKPYVWWWWMDGQVTKEGITADLEAMKRVGVGGFRTFEMTSGLPSGPVQYMRQSWHDMVKHTLKEASRLGLKASFHNSAGCSATGGPWITPEYAMQKIVWTETQVEGPKPFAAKLEMPESNKDYYRDTVVLAFPSPESEYTGEGFRIKDWKFKAGFKRKTGVLMPDQRKVDREDSISKEKVLVLSDKLDANGLLQWQVPEGKWTIIRFGYTPTGAINTPSPLAGRGLECDKLNPKAVELSWKNTVGKIIKDAGPLAGTVLDASIIDSYEKKTQNWTARLPQEFENRMGYDLISYMPALTGRVVESLEVSERFLWDFRKAIADMFAEYYYGHFAELCHRNGLVFVNEPYGDGNFSCYTIASKADIPMGEFWTYKMQQWLFWTSKVASSAAHTYGRKYVGAEAFTSLKKHLAEHPYKLKTLGDYFYCRGVNRFSIHGFVHQPWMDVRPGMTYYGYGTAFNRNNTWFEKSSAWVDYLTRCQSLLQEGQFVADIAYYVGEEIGNSNRQQRELDPSPPAGYDYDFCTTEILMQMTVKEGRILLPNGMSYRLLALPPKSVKMRLEVLRKVRDLVKAGAVVYGDRPESSPSLQGYPECDAEVHRIADQLWGTEPVVTEPSCFGKGKVFSKGSLAENLKSIHVLPDFECSGGSNEPLDRPGPGTDYIHRRIGTTDLYFVSNQHERSNQIDAVFRVQGKRPEIWYPDTAEIKEAPLYSFTNDGRIVVPLSLDSADSVFVVFRNSADEERRVESVESLAGIAADVEISAQEGRVVLTTLKSGQYEVKMATGKQVTVEGNVSEPISIEGPWTLRFPKGWGAPEEIKLDRLIDWTEHGHYDIKHFSGTATYINEFNFQAGSVCTEDIMLLDLGAVHVIAQVKLNGQDLGILWKPPFQVDVSKVIKSGNNRLEIEVTNCWPNRLIGDEKYPNEDGYQWHEPKKRDGWRPKKMPTWFVKGEKRAPTERKTFATWKWYTQGEPLLNSGLLGPVRLISGKKIVVD